LEKEIKTLEKLHDDNHKEYEEEDEFIILHTRGGSAES
tara:strand:+ start:7976 stop:8089 length:114 start_codon:yes stop_codon:yes gene_type:complete